MSKPKKETRTKKYLADSNDLFLAMFSLGTKEELEKLLSDLLTESEIRMLKRRWHVASLVNEGRTVREASEIAEVGTDTVIRVIKKIKSANGILKKILLEKKPAIERRFNIINSRRKKTTKWFFGVK